MTDNPRLEAIVHRVITDLRDAITDLAITEDEWFTALEFLTDVASHQEMILLSDVLGLSVLVDDVNHEAVADRTESSVLGPFWREAPALPNPAQICASDEPGEPLVLSGVVRSTDGTALADAEIDVWQADASGHYDVECGRYPSLRGRLHTDPGGHYEIQTIVAPPYEIPKDGPVGRLLAATHRHAFRPAHIHLKVDAPGFAALTTMIFFENDPWLHNDVIGAQKSALTIPIDHTETTARANFDITLRPAPGPTDLGR